MFGLYVYMPLYITNPNIISSNKSSTVAINDGCRYRNLLLTMIFTMMKLILPSTIMTEAKVSVIMLISMMMVLMMLTMMMIMMTTPKQIMTMKRTLMMKIVKMMIKSSPKIHIEVRSIF